MRVFRGLDMVEQLGSGIPQILAAYSQSIYHFTPNFIRLVFPFEEGFEVLTGQAAAQAEVNKNQGESDKDDVTAQANKLLVFCSKPRLKIYLAGVIHSFQIVPILTVSNIKLIRTGWFIRYRLQ
jgi:predicted HTH transcriptional regulator